MDDRVDPDALPPQPWRRSGEPRRQLSQGRIVAAALQVLDREGLDGVTMRKVARQLGTGAASLYAHVRDKAELHELMLDAVASTARPPAPDPDRWVDQLKEFALEITDAMASRPGIARIALETLIPTTPYVLSTIDGLLGLLKAGGLSDEDALVSADILALYTAAGAYERSLRSTAEATAEARARVDRISDYLQIVPVGRLPHLLALAPQMREQPDGYRIGLELLIDGIAARAADPDRTSG